MTQDYAAPTDDDDPTYNGIIGPPANPNPTEQALLGAMMLNPKAIDAALTTGLERQAFTTRGHPEIFAAIIELHHAGKQADALTVTNHIGKQAGRFGGATYLVELTATCPATSSAPTYAQTIHDNWTATQARWALADAAQSLDNGDNPRTVIARIADRLPADYTVGNQLRAINGATFLLDTPDTLTNVWGEKDVTLWAEGEPTMIVGPSGIGKTTVGQQVVLGRLGLRPHVLGAPVQPGRHRVLYLAMDRPSQAQRSMTRMVTEDDRSILEDYSTFWKGPLPFNLVDDPSALTRFARQHAADTLVIDSLKDICHKLTDDEQASKTNAAIQELVASGIEVLVLHHQRKQGAAAKKDGPPKSLDDVYGSTWLVAGMGSVILIWGQAGDPLVELSHLKSPAEQAGPWTLHMDFDRGYTTIEEQANPLKIVGSATRGATVHLVASIMFKNETPTRNELEKARRRLDKLVDQGHIHRQETPTDGGGKPTVLYFSIDTRRTA